MAEETFVIKAKDDTKAAFASIDRGLSKLGISFGALAGVAGAAALASFVKSAIDAADHAQKMADRLGITTEAYSKLGYVAKQTGADQGALDGALQQMNRRLSEAALGSGEAAKAYAALGLNAKQLASESPDQAFEKIVAALEKVPNANDRAMLSAKLFGKQGQELNNVLALGADGLREMGTEAELLGAVIDSKTAAAADQFNDNLDKLGTLSQGVGMKMAEHLLPALNGITEAMVGAAKESKALDGFGKALGFTMNSLATAAIEVATGFELVASWTIAAGNAAAAAAKGNFAEAKNIMQKNGEEILAINEKTAKALDKIWTEQAPTEKPRKPKPGGGGADMSGLGGSKEKDPAEKFREDAAKKFEAMNDSLMTENERIAADYEAKILALDNFYMTSEMTEDGYRLRREQLEQQHQSKLSDIAQAEADKRKQFDEMVGRLKLSTTQQILGDLSSLMSSQSKKQFEIGKKAAIADAVISTYLGAQNAFTQASKFGGLPLAIAAASAATIAGMVRVNAIRSQQFGGTGSAAPGGGATPTYNANPNTGQPTQPIGLPESNADRSRGTVNISILGNLIGNQEYINDYLIPGIREAVNEKDEVIISSRSRQAAEIGAFA